MDLGFSGVVPPPGPGAGAERQLDIGVGGQAVHFGLVHVVNPVRRRLLPGCFVLDRDTSLGRAVGVAGFVPAELGVGAGFQAKQLRADQGASVAGQAVERGADQSQAVLVVAEGGRQLGHVADDLGAEIGAGAFPAGVQGQQVIPLGDPEQALVVGHPASQLGKFGGDLEQPLGDGGRVMPGERFRYGVELAYDGLAPEAACAGGVPAAEQT